MPKDKIGMLLVEDNPGDARLVKEALKNANSIEFDLTHVVRFKEAEDILNKTKFDLILLDLSLPDSSGVETFKKMHSLFPKIPIVVLTGYEDESVAFDALQTGIEMYLIKGKIQPKLLTEALDYAVEKNKMFASLDNL